MDDTNKRIMFQAAVNEMVLNPFGIHGVMHWHNVYWNALHIWRVLRDTHEVAPKDDWFFWSFAMLHDCRRESDTIDLEHPFRAAKLIPDDNTDFNRKLRVAISSHTSGRTADDMHIGTCWDADRLDLPRINIVPNPEQMSTEVGKQFAEQMKAPPIDTIIN